MTENIKRGIQVVDESALKEVSKNEWNESENCSQRNLQRSVKEVTKRSTIDNLQLNEKSLRHKMNSPCFEEHQELVWPEWDRTQESLGICQVEVLA